MPSAGRSMFAALLCALTLVLAVGCSGRRASAPPYGSGAGAPTLTEVSALLDRHGHAVLQRSPSRFLADVDRSSAAATFRGQQSAEIGALSAVPLHTWSYTVSAPATDAAAVRAAAKRFGAPATIVHLTLAYAFAGIDTTPVTHDLWWTFVQRHGHVYVAGDSDLAGLGGDSWRGPWDFGPLVVARGADSLVLGHPADSARLPGLASEVDAATAAVTAVWGSDWNRRVAVEVPASAAEFAALGGSAGAASPGTATAAPDVSAETVFETSGGVDSAARVLLNPTALDALTPTGRGIVLRHEVTHAATITSTPIGTPSWLVEGFADYVGNLTSGQSVPTAAMELRATVRRGQLPTALPTDAQFSGSGNLAAVYEESWLACRLIAARAGQAGLVRFYRLVGASLTSADAAVASAMAAVLHESVATFVAQWRQYLVAELR